MPELPEVETVRRGLDRLVVGHWIAKATIRVPKMVKTDLDQLRLTLPGLTIEAMRRRGKYLIFDLGTMVLISHLRMEGKYLLFPDQVPDNKHFHVFFELDDGSTLVYQDVRKFGTFDFIPKAQEEAFFRLKKMGPEPTAKTFKLAPFERAVLASHKAIKPLLLDQRLVAGLGNIYVDEVLWAARVHPMTPGHRLKKAQIKRIHDETIRILTLGIEKGGSTIRTYRNALGEDGSMQEHLQVYARTGEPCARCGSSLVKLTVGGRGTHICPHCQKEDV